MTTEPEDDDMGLRDILLIILGLIIIGLVANGTTGGDLLAALDNGWDAAWAWCERVLG